MGMLQMAYNSSSRRYNQTYGIGSQVSTSRRRTDSNYISPYRQRSSSEDVVRSSSRYHSSTSVDESSSSSFYNGYGSSSLSSSSSSSKLNRNTDLLISKTKELSLGAARRRSVSTSAEVDTSYSSSKYQPSLLCNSPKRSPDLISGYRKEEGDGTVGLTNIGNTCFMNSMIHCLSNTVPLREYILSSRCKDELNSSSKMKGKLMTCFIDLLKQLWAADTKGAVTPRNFKSQIQKFSPRFGGYEQQDSQEFLRFLLEGLHEDINKVKVRSKKGVPEFHNLSAQEQAAKTWLWYKSKDDSYIFDLFVGQLESALKCSECRNVSLTFDPFWDLSLPIAKSFYSNEQTQLEECLSNFTKEETLDGDEKPFCEKCKARRKMTKKLSIHKFQRYLFYI